MPYLSSATLRALRMPGPRRARERQIFAGLADVAALPEKVIGRIVLAAISAIAPNPIAGDSLPAAALH